MNSYERSYIVPIHALYGSVAFLLESCPSSVLVEPELLLEDVVRSAFYGNPRPGDHMGVQRGVVTFNSRDPIAISFLDLANDILIEITAELNDTFRFHDVNTGHLIDYVCHRGSHSMALRVRDYGLTSR